MDAVNPIDNLNAARQVQQALRKDPNDIESLLRLAAMLGALRKPDLDQKRKVLHRVLSLEPANPQARQMLFEMDRAAIGGDPSRLSSAVILTSQAAGNLGEKPLVLRYSLVHQLLVYLLIAFTMFIMLSSIQDGEVLAVFAAFLVFLLIPLWFVSAVIEINDTELKVSRLFGVARTEIPWSEIKEFKSGVLGQGMKVISLDGRVMEISSQTMGYSSVIEILRQMRPDLFQVTNDFTSGGAVQGSSSASGAQARTFQRNALVKYGPFFLLIPAVLIFLGSAVTFQCLVAIPAALIFFLVWRAAFHTPHQLILTENQLSTQSFRRKLDITPQQIKDIRMGVTYQPKARWARRHIQVELVDGTSFRLAGFVDGDELVYGTLKNWWAAHQSA
jgi:hypothetical protein